MSHYIILWSALTHKLLTIGLRLTPAAQLSLSVRPRLENLIKCEVRRFR